MRTRIISVLLALTALAGAAFAQPSAWQARTGGVISLEGGHLNFEGPPVQGAPYSAEAVSTMTQTLPDGNRIERESRSRIWRDSQGRTRREQTLASIGPWASPQEPQTIIFINDPTTGEHYVIDPEAKTVRKTPTPKLHAARLPVPQQNVQAPAQDLGEAVVDRTVEVRRAVPASPGKGDRTKAVSTFVFRSGRVNADEGEAKTESLGSDIIEGLAVEGERVTTTIPAGAIGNEREIVTTFERWHSPELGIDVKTVRNDPRQGEYVYRLENIQRIEPDASLFVPPADYEVVDGPDLGHFEIRKRRTTP